MESATFELNDLQQSQSELGKAWFEFLNVDSMSIGLYRVPAGTSDQDAHDPHEQDEVYVGIEGRGKLTVDGQVHDVGPRSVIFVRSGVVHFFHDVTVDLALLVVFAGSK